MKKRIIATLFMISMLFGMLSTAGCGKTEVKNDPAEASKLVKTLREKYYVKDNVNLDWYIGINWWQYNNDWTDYPVLNEVTQITGVKPKVSIPTGDGTEKLNMMMVSGEFPDLLTIGTDDPILDTLISQGYVYSYDELIELYAPELKDEIDPTVWNYSTWEDGKLYQLPCFFVKDANSTGASTYNVKEDVYKELGEPDMTTPEGFYNALKAFKEKYPTIEGKSSIPLTFGSGYFRYMLEESFGISEYYVNPENNVEIRFKNPQYEQLAKYLNKLYREGLLDPEVFIKQDSALEEDLAAGRVFCYPCVYWQLDNANAALNAQKAGTGYTSIEPMQAVEKVSFPGTNRRGWLVTLIPKTTKHPEEVIKFIRFMWSREGNLLVNYGHENEHYTIEGDTIIPTKEVEEAKLKDPEGFANSTGIFTYRLFYYPYYTEQLSENAAKLHNDELAQKYGRDNTVLTYKMGPQSTTKEGEISQKVWSIYETEWPKMVMAKSEDTAIDILHKMISSMEAQGLSVLEEYWTDRYHKNVEKFK